MSERVNELGQPVGPPVPNWQPRPRPPRAALEGRYCRVEPLDVARRAAELHAANSEDPTGRMWTYLMYGPHRTLADYVAWLEPRQASADPLFFVIVDAATGRGVGLASWLRIEPDHGTVEVGHLQYSPRLQRTPAATEAMYLMMKQAFDLGYRRYEWKCDSLNAGSRRAAERLGFRYEGTFRQAVVYKGRSRDSAWYSVIDAEWPTRAAAFERWLDPANFDDQGAQRRTLAACREQNA
jgi:RimJ/RimL family protein N-acetyltransferase